MHARFAPLLGVILVALVCTSVFALPTTSAHQADSHHLLSVRANPDFPDPTTDPFYRAPKDLASAANGKVLRRRSFPSVFNSTNLASAYQLYYRTLDTQLAAEGTVAAIHVPAKPVSPTRILSVQYYQDSVSVNCAPSWAAVKDSGSGTAVETFLDPGTYTNYALSKGWYVVSADFEGPKAQFIAGYQAGRAVLDGIKALINDQKLPQDSKVAMVGYSGGAHATVWAETLHGEYAPSLNVVGTAHGGTPVDPRGTLLAVNKGPTAGFGFAGLLGLMSAHPPLDDYVNSIVTEAGKKKLVELRQPGYCLPSVATGNPFGEVFSYTNATNPLDNPIAVKVLKEESLLSDYAGRAIPVPTFPRFLYHSLFDEIVPYADEQKYVKDQCSRGADIQFSTLAVAEHVSGVFAGVPASIDFINQAFEGTTPKVQCGSVLPQAKFSLDDPKADQVMGKDIADHAKAGRARAQNLGF